VLLWKQWIDAGGNPAVRHEGGAPSNNLIKDAPHRATVFVGPTLKSLFLNSGSSGRVYGFDSHPILFIYPVVFRDKNTLLYEKETLRATGVR
jgi:hypothetical protein